MKKSKMKTLFASIFVIVLTYIGLFFYYNKPFNITELDRFSPFTHSKLIAVLKEDSILKLEKDLPKIEAATAFYPLASSIVQAVYNESLYKSELRYVSTTEAYQDILKDDTDMVIATAPSEDQQKLIDKSGVKLSFVSIGKEPLIFYVPKENSVNNISIGQIRDIYMGKITNWKELNGKHLEINTFQLKNNNGSQTCLQQILHTPNIIDERHKYSEDMGKIIVDTANDPRGIGYAFNSYYTKAFSSSKLKLLKIENVEPNMENFNNLKYTLMFDVYAVYKTDTKNENVRKIIDWVLSQQGKKIISEMGVVSEDDGITYY